MNTKYRVTITLANGQTKNRTFRTQEEAKAYREGIIAASETTVYETSRVTKVQTSAGRPPAVNV